MRTRGLNKAGTKLDHLLTEFDTVHRNKDRLVKSLIFDNGKSVQLRSTIGHIDDFALLQIVSVKFIEDLSISFTVYTKTFAAQSFTMAAEIDEQVTAREVRQTLVAH